MLGQRRTLDIDEIIEYLDKGKRFGLFDSNKSNGGTYYFEDGAKMRNEDLWEALRIKFNLERGHGKTLKELTPDNYIGSFITSRKKYKWNKAS